MKSAVRVLGPIFDGLFFKVVSIWNIGLLIAEKDLLEKVNKFSTDKKNYSLEFNEFLKMMAIEMKRDANRTAAELTDAFRFTFLAAIAL